MTGGKPTCCVLHVQPQAGKAPPHGTGSLDSAGGEGQDDAAGQIVAALHKAPQQAGHVEGPPLGAVNDALSGTGQEGPDSQPQMMQNTHRCTCSMQGTIYFRLSQKRQAEYAAPAACKAMFQFEPREAKLKMLPEALWM